MNGTFPSAFCLDSPPALREATARCDSGPGRRRDTYKRGLCFPYRFCWCAQDLCAYDITFPRCLRVSIFLVCPHSSSIQAVIGKSVLSTLYVIESL